PGWDEVVAHGLSAGKKQPPGPDPLSGLGAPASRDAQRAICEEGAREEARRFLSAAKEAAEKADPGVLVSAHAALLRLAALAAIHPLLALPEDAHAGDLPPP